MLKNNLLAEDILNDIKLLENKLNGDEKYQIRTIENDFFLPGKEPIKKTITEDEVDLKFEDFLNKCHRFQSIDKKILIKKAYLLAKDAHKRAKRNSGDAFINHPVEVAKIVTEDIGLGVTSAVCALLHDVVSNSDYTIEDIEHFFGKNVAKIVENLTIIKGTSQYFTSDQSEVYRKLLIGISEDVRIIFIKLADRLHNMRTLDSLNKERQKQVAYETRYIYAPLAERLGLFKIKSELEDLAFKYLNPIEYNIISQQIEKNSRKEHIFINRFSLPIIFGLHKKGIKFEIKSRLKSIYSIYKKIQNKKVSFNEVYDILAIRIIFDPKNPEKEVEECLEIYNYITSLYKEKEGRTRNWLGENKKTTGYEALHVTVRGANNRWVEIQIRSKKMNDAAEMGFAAHWKYKGIEDKKVEFDNKIFELRYKLEQIDNEDFDYLENFKLLFTTEIVIYTPRGKEIMMPVGSTALDYAFYIHTQVGSSAIAAKINRKLTGLEHILQSGDTVEIITSVKSHPKSEWLDIVKTEKAKKTIKELLNKEQINEQEKGNKILTKIFDELEIVSTTEIIRDLNKTFDAKNKNDFLYLLGSDIIEEEDIKEHLRKKHKNKFIKYWKPQLSKKIIKKEAQKNDFIIDENLHNSSYHISECCFPIPGDEVIGLLNTKTSKIYIHKINCIKVNQLSKKSMHKKVPIIWKTYKALSYLTKIQIEGQDEIGIINKITTLLSKDLEINIKSLHIDADGIMFTGWMEVYVHNTKHLDVLLSKVEKIEGILKVTTVAHI